MQHWACTYRRPSAAHVLTHVPSPESGRQSTSRLPKNAELLTPAVLNKQCHGYARCNHPTHQWRMPMDCRLQPSIDSAIYWVHHIIFQIFTSQAKGHDMPSATTCVSQLCNGYGAEERFCMQIAICKMCAFSDFAMACFLLCLWLWTRSDKWGWGWGQPVSQLLVWS
jgi:hypothetical protein